MKASLAAADWLKIHSNDVKGTACFNFHLRNVQTSQEADSSIEEPGSRGGLRYKV
jgi:hypothetical protein